VGRGSFLWCEEGITGKKGGNGFPRKKIGKFMAGRKIGMLKKWREHTFQSESEKKKQKKSPEFGIPRNSGGIPAEFPT